MTPPNVPAHRAADRPRDERQWSGLLRAGEGSTADLDRAASRTSIARGDPPRLDACDRSLGRRQRSAPRDASQILGASWRGIGIAARLTIRRDAKAAAALPAPTAPPPVVFAPDPDSLQSSCLQADGFLASPRGHEISPTRGSLTRPPRTPRVFSSAPARAPGAARVPCVAAASTIVRFDSLAGNDVVPPGRHVALRDGSVGSTSLHIDLR
jgi:hypothetical protein